MTSFRAWAGPRRSQNVMLLLLPGALPLGKKRRLVRPLLP
jgi:hypothetical protein